MRQPLRRLYLLYHELRPGGSSYSYVVGTEMFERHADLYVQLRGAGADVWPEITFDDGHISNIEFAAPILQSRGLTARFFITVGWTGKKAGYMGWPELRALQAGGHAIGAHGWTHTLLTHCSEKELQMELEDARLALEDRLGASVTTMSLPGGRYNRRVLSACAEAGYTQIYTSIPRAEASSAGSLVGRLNIRGDRELGWIESLFAADGKVLSSLGRQYRMKEAAKALLGDRMYAKLWAALNRQEPDGDGADSV